MQKRAEISRCRLYRYALWRVWDEDLPTVLFVGLNPSTADEVTDDPTLIRCMNFARVWGYGGVCIGNLFAYRATDPKVLLSVKDPIGAENDVWLAKLAEDAGLIVAAWGNMGPYLDRSQQVRPLLPNLHCLKLNKSGEPAHPLYLKADLRPFLLKK